MRERTWRRHAALALLSSSSLIAACTRGNETRATESGVERVNERVAPAPTPSLRAPDVPYEPSPEHVVTEIIRLARLVPGDVLYDLGCGDGRIVIAAVEKPGVRGVCVDIDPERIAESRENARRAKVLDRITFLTQDLFETNFRDATVVTLFLWPKINLRLRPKLLGELAPGTRVISYMHDMGDWAPNETVPVHSGTRDTAVYLWLIPRAPERDSNEAGR